MKDEKIIAHMRVETDYVKACSDADHRYLAMSISSAVWMIFYIWWVNYLDWTKESVILMMVADILATVYFHSESIKQKEQAHDKRVLAHKEL